MRRKAAKFAKDVETRDRRVRELEDAHGKLDERQAELDERAAEIAADAIAMKKTAEIAQLQARVQEQAERVARNDRVAARAQQAADRKHAEAELRQRRVLAAEGCFDVCIQCSSQYDVETWQVLAHRAIHGDMAELAEVEELLTPEPTARPQRQPRNPDRKRRRRNRQNVVDFPRSR